MTRLSQLTARAVRRHLEWIFTVTTRRPATVFVVCCLVFLVSCLSIARIRFESDIFKMFPRTGPLSLSLSLFLDTMQWSGSAGNAFFLLEGERGKLVPEAEAFAAKLRELRVDGVPAFSRVRYTVFDASDAKSFADFIGYAVTRPQLFVAPGDVSAYSRMLSPQSVDEALKKAKGELGAPGAFSDVIAADPLYLRELILPRLKKASESLNLDPSSPYFLSRDGRVLIIIAEPSRPVADIAFARKIVAGINEARKGAGVSISCAGAHLSAVTDEAVMKENVIVGLFSSLILVLALFYSAYRRFLPTVLIPVILCFGIVLSVAVGGFVYPTMSIVSFAFASLIVGIGTDYTIHLYDRFHFERAAGKPAAEALRLSTVDTGHALFTAGTTTALPFLALVVSDVRALAELGLLVGLGVIFSLYATLFFLPPLLLFMEKKYPLKEYRPLPSFGLGRLWEAGQRHPRAATGLFLATVACLVASASGISFEGELKNLQPKSSEAFLTQEKLERHLSISPKEMIVAVEGKDLQQVLAQGSRVAALAEGYRREGKLVAFSSLLNVLNDEKAQRQVISELAANQTLGGVRREITAALTREGFASEPFSGYIDGLAALSRAPVLPVADGVAHMAESPFRGIVERHLAHTESGYHLLTYLNYQGAEFPQEAFLNSLQKVAPGARATGVDLISRQLGDSVKQSFARAAAIGAVLILFLLLSHFNSLSGIVYSLVPVTAGVIAMLGVMALCGMKLNFMNVMVLVTILGMGSDYGLHVAHRIRNCGSDEFRGRYIQSGRAVLLSALTTIAGFGSLALTDYGAMASIGWATNFGVVATTVFTLALLPSLMLFFGIRDKRVRTISNK